MTGVNRPEDVPAEVEMCQGEVVHQIFRQARRTEILEVALHQV